MKIFVDENIPLGKEVFGRFGDVEVKGGRDFSNQGLEKADALIVRSITRVTEDLLKGTPVKFVGTATIGTDHIDIPYLEQNGIGFSSAPGCNSNSVGEYITTALLHLQDTTGIPLHTMTMGIVGCGNVGSNTSAKVRALGLKVLHNDPPLKKSGSDKFGFVSIGEIQNQADIITFHVPMVKDGEYPTYELLNRDFLNKLSRPVIIMNTSRGHVINKNDVMEAKDKGLISHMVLDVFPDEPAPDPELINRCTIATSHIAGYSVQGKHNGTYQILKSFCGFFKLPYPRDTPMPKPSDPRIIIENTDLRSVVYRTAIKAYPIMEDDKRLRESLDEENPGAEFDKLRKNYPRRFEFPCYELQGEDNEGLETLKKLGFGIV